MKWWPFQERRMAERIGNFSPLLKEPCLRNAYERLQCQYTGFEGTGSLDLSIGADDRKWRGRECALQAIGSSYVGIQDER